MSRSSWQSLDQHLAMLRSLLLCNLEINLLIYKRVSLNAGNLLFEFSFDTPFNLFYISYQIQLAQIIEGFRFD